jgi:selenocysteine-specific translation elongation factor
MPEIEIAKVVDFFAKPVVAGLSVTVPFKVGDTIRIKGSTTDITMTVQSMQIDNISVQEVKAGDSVGIKVPDRVRRGDTVFQVTA